MNQVVPDNEFTQWRLWSRSCGVADMIAAAAAISLYAVAGIDSVVSWPSNQVLLSDPDLVRIAVVLLAPTLVWLIVSAGMVYGRTQSWRLSQLPAGPRACFVAAVVVCAAVIVGGFRRFSRCSVAAVAAAGLLLPERFSRCCPQPG